MFDLVPLTVIVDLPQLPDYKLITQKLVGSAHLAGSKLLCALAPSPRFKAI